jgi:hypothetical protein
MCGIELVVFCRRCVLFDVWGRFGGVVKTVCAVGYVGDRWWNFEDGVSWVIYGAFLLEF